MDLIYMPEVLSYGSLRHPQYRDYEQPWNKDYFNYGKSTTKTKTQHRQQPQKTASSKSTCQLCKENKRRTLAAYIRGKARNNSCSEIHEEIEEIDEEEEGEELEEKTVKIEEKKLSSENESKNSIVNAGKSVKDVN